LDELVTWALFEKATKKLAERIIVLKESGVVKSIYGISRGGLVVAVRLSHMLDLPLILDSKEIQPHTLVVDDIADSGKTLWKYKNSLIATLYYNERSAVIPKFWIFKKKDKWIVFPWET
jgi:hypoxanthine phosphoribosyltransferase